MLWLNYVMIGAYILCTIIQAIQVLCRQIAKRKRHCAIATNLIYSADRNSIQNDFQLTLFVHSVFSVMRYSYKIALHDGAMENYGLEKINIIVHLMAMLTQLIGNIWIACGLLHMNNALVKVNIEKKSYLKFYRFYAYLTPLAAVIGYVVAICCFDEKKSCDLSAVAPWIMYLANTGINLFCSGFSVKLTKGILSQRMKRQGGRQASKIKVFFSSGIMVPLFSVQIIVVCVKVFTNLLTKETYDYAFNFVSVSLFLFWILFNCIYNHEVTQVLSSALSKICTGPVIELECVNRPTNKNETEVASVAAADGNCSSDEENDAGPTTIQVVVDIEHYDNNEQLEEETEIS